jgi:hypothetical protein
LIAVVALVLLALLLGLLGMIVYATVRQLGGEVRRATDEGEL